MESNIELDSEYDLNINLALPEYIQDALDSDIEELSYHDITSGNWISPLFYFARFMKVHPELLGIKDGWDTYDIISQYIEFDTIEVPWENCDNLYDDYSQRPS